MTELRHLRREHPELAPAVDLQLELLEIQRRVLPRISLPAELLHQPVPDPREDGRAMLTWACVPLEWGEFRAVLRETIDALVRSGDLESSDARFLTEIARDGDRLPAFLEVWFRNRVEGDPCPHRCGDSHADLARVEDQTLDSPLWLALKPFLGRCADLVAPRLALDGWERGSCPLCSGEPELLITSDAQSRRLLCGRCSLRWPYPDRRCPFCGNLDPSRLRSLASADRAYGFTACELCRRYVKVYDERHARRAALPAADLIRMLPLDALAIQRGYR